MSKVTVTVVTVKTDLPAGVIAGDLRVSISQTDGAIVDSQDVDGNEAVFTGIVDGDYIATAVRLDDIGENIGVPISVIFSVDDVQDTYGSPESLSVVVEAE